MRMRTRSLSCCWSVAVAIALVAGAVHADAISARAGIEANSVFVGEPVRFQVQVSGSENPEQPDLSTLDGFRAIFQGGGANSRRSISIVNGRRTENVQLGFVFNYELRATREGRLTIPAIPVQVEGRTVRTQPLTVMAQKPSETENYKLRLNLSKDEAYVGEQLVLEAVFYYRGEVAGTNLSLPILDDGAFEVHDFEGDQPSSKVETLGGQQFQTGRMRKVLVPTRAGKIAMEPATLSFRGQDGFEIARDFFGNRVRRPKYKNYVIPSNAPELTIRPLPTEGRPDGFAGHVGEYSLSVQASPTEVNVGDPITLNIALSGPPLLEPVEMPPLHEQASLTRDFKVPGEMADGSVNGNFKLFTQTIRALREDVTAIPPLELVYFDTVQGRYEVARTEPISIVVRPTRVVTAGDVEGGDPIGAAQQGLQSWSQGIAHNYTGVEALRRQPLGFAGLLAPGRLVILAGPPLLYAVLLGTVLVRRRRHANPELLRARRALVRFEREITRAASADDVLGTFCHFLGDKLGLTSDALTFRDVEGRLRNRGLDEDTLRQIKGLFTAGEASRFAGGGGTVEGESAKQDARRLVAQLEKILR